MVELSDSAFNWCLNLPVCDFKCGVILGENACVEQMSNPGVFA